MKPLYILTVICLSLVSCNPEPEAIEYGKDSCSYCKMTIIDKKFGSELINKNGKMMKFDSGECMFSYLKANKDFKATRYLIADYENPGQLIDAQKACYLHGGNIISPMGGSLAAFNSKEAAEKFQADLKGDLFLWDEARELNF